MDLHGVPDQFERIGIQTTVPLLLGFLVVCVAEIVVGVMILAGTHNAPAVSYALLPFEFIFWIGFALPLDRSWVWRARCCC